MCVGGSLVLAQYTTALQGLGFKLATLRSFNHPVTGFPLKYEANMTQFLSLKIIIKNARFISKNYFLMAVRLLSFLKYILLREE